MHPSSSVSKEKYASKIKKQKKVLTVKSKKNKEEGKNAIRAQKKTVGKKSKTKQLKKSLIAKVVKKGGQSSRQSGSSCLASNCLDLMVYYLGINRGKVTNYQKQVAIWFCPMQF